MSGRSFLRVRGCALACLAGGIAAVCGAAEPPTGQPDRLNVVVIVSDALRADHLGCYGYRRPTTPVIDTLARQGVLFERASSNSSITRESVSVIFTGRWASCSGATPWDARPPVGLPCLPTLFKEAGYATAFVNGSYVLTEQPFVDGLPFDKVVHPAGTDSIRTGLDLSQQALAFVKACAGRPFMMYIHYLEPHGPYEPCSEDYLRFVHEPFAKPVHLYSDVRAHILDYTKDGFGPGDPRFEDLVARYDAEIAGVDHAVDVLVEGLRTQGVLDRTLIAFTADHGEEFMEHEFVEHGWTLYGEVLHVPLILWAPARLQPARVSGPVSHVDVLPTILSVAGIPYASAAFDGTALFELREGRFCPTTPPRPLFAEVLLDQRSMLRAVADGEWKYIAATRWLPVEARPEAARLIRTVSEELASGKRKLLDIWAPVTHRELYDLAKDPGERRNLIEECPAKAEALQEELDRFHEHCLAHGFAAGGTASGQCALTPENIQRLDALGYMGDK